MRYRHTDTDIVRSARQQDFLSDARQRVPVAGPASSASSDLIDIFTEYTTSDISDAETMLQVLKLFVASRNAAIKEVHFPAELGPELRLRLAGSDPRSGRTSSSAAKRAAARAARSKSAPKTKAAKKHEGGKKKQEAEASRSVEAPKPPGSDGLVPARRSRRSSRRSRSPARSAAASRSSTRPGCPRAPPTSKATPTSTSWTRASTTSRTRRQAPRPPTGWSLELELPDGTHYFGVQGIQGWADPPILDNPSLTEDDPRPRIRHLRRRRPGQDGRLAPRRQHLLGRRTTCCRR